MFLIPIILLNMLLYTVPLFNVAPTYFFSACTEKGSGEAEKKEFVHVCLFHSITELANVYITYTYAYKYARMKGVYVFF